MKKLLTALLCVVLALGCFACTSNEGNNDNKKDYKVAMITDYGDITDQSFNQTTHEASKAFCEANNVKYKYFKPATNDDAGRIASAELAISEGYNVIVMPGYAFGGTIDEIAAENSNVKFVALDVGAGDLKKPLSSNATSFIYKEELSGFMAGYAAVKEGYKKLGFLGGMAVPAVTRFGYGYVQGADKAAAELGIANQVSINYVYGGIFNSDPGVTSVMDTWYQTNGVEVVFACGGGIYGSACQAAKKVTGGKVIGVDTDQHAIITANYNDENLCITSAMKGLAATVKTALTDIILKNSADWDTKYAGKIATLGLVSGTDVESNYVQLPIAEGSWKMTKFTVNDYKALVAKMFNGEITVSSDINAHPTVAIHVDYQKTIKQ